MPLTNSFTDCLMTPPSSGSPFTSAEVKIFASQEQLKYWAGTYIPALFDQNIYTPAMSEENGEVVGADTIKKTGCFSSNPDDHVKFVRQYLELGFDTLIFHSAGPDQRAFLAGYGRDVLPRLRNHLPR